MEKLLTLEEKNIPVFKGRKISTNNSGYSYILLPRSAVTHLDTKYVDIVLTDDGVLLRRRQ